MTVREFKLGDPCPGCGGELRKAIQPTDAERNRAADRDNPHPLPPHYDTAPKDVVDELGELYTCRDCGYPHREKPAASKPAKSSKKSKGDEPTDDDK